MNTDSTQTNDTTPLWKRLNEERTQGKWFCDIGDFDRNQRVSEIYVRSVDDGEISDVFSLICNDTVSAKPDAAYTALSVNNLHILAEALEDLLNADELDQIGKFKAEQKAMQALKAIS